MCRFGEENLCDKPRSLGFYVDGAYSEYLLIHRYMYLVKTGADMDTNTAAALSRSFLTEYSAFKNDNLKVNN
ncbi:MAG: alcohol dehydrogenase catalytic domain-containing protein, partial [Thermoproteota archaeon]|nr:alcohol dehydrogenase catalytic domain-containing protein [Thermoproteota archaeon]